MFCCHGGQWSPWLCKNTQPFFFFNRMQDADKCFAVLGSASNSLLIQQQFCMSGKKWRQENWRKPHTHTLLNLPFNHRSLPKGNKPPNNQFLKLHSRIMLIMLTTAVRFFFLKTMLQLVLWKVENVLQQWCSALFKAVCLHRQDASCTYRLSSVRSLWALLLHSVGNEWGCLACCHCNLMASLNGTVAFLCSWIPQAAPSRY